ncbi:unnamed protein product [Leptosia nina]|uniref:MADF domain-containing protein n=1 Tax=Leptosia nina TaxID=320188 RepID=A0AAV1IYL4_9NEOP
MSRKDFAFNPVRLIEEVKKRPCLYDQWAQPPDKGEKLQLWKEVGAALFPDWTTYDRATAYDTVLQLQKKWRSLRDAYNRELRSRKSGVRVHRRVYVYFKKLKFLGGFDGVVSSDSDDEDDRTRAVPAEEKEEEGDVEEDDVKTELFEEVWVKPKTRNRRSKRPSSALTPERAAAPSFSGESADEGDSDRLFLLSFLPEIKPLPPNIKMWVRAQIASVMEEAVAAHMSDTQPTASFARRRPIKSRGSTPTGLHT